jgi:serine/threonine-protein kinase
MLSPHPEARGSAREVAEALEQAARSAGRDADVPLFTGDEPLPAGMSPLSQRDAVERPPRMRRWPSLAAAGLAGTLALSAGGLLSVSGSQEPATPHRAAQEEAKDAGTVAVGDSALTASEAPEPSPSVWSSVAVDMPPKPFQGQRRPDANGRCPNKEQVVINGGCWRKLPVDVKDCDDSDGFEYRSACYFPVMVKQRPATSAPANRDESP